MKLRGSLFSLSLIIIGYVSIQASPLNAQSLTVSGKVTSADNEQPMVGVNILVQGTDQGTTTDAGGNYTLGLDNPGATLVFSYIGYATKEIPVDNQTTLNVSLEIDALGLDEVVAIGYGYVKKSDLTGSVGTINQKLLNSQAVENPLMALTGTTSGVQVLQNSGLLLMDSRLLEIWIT